MIGIFVKSIIITLVFMGFFIFAVSACVAHVSALWQGWQYASYVPWLAGIGAFILAWLLFPALMPLIISFFDNSIINTIETQEYPSQLDRIRVAPGQQFFHDLGFAAKAILLNIIALPFYLIPVVNLFLFYALNGYLLGNEFYLAVARRHLPLVEAKAARKRDAGNVFFGGVVLVFFSTIPLVNLIAPFWAIALMTHLYHLNKPKSRADIEVK